MPLIPKPAWGLLPVSDFPLADMPPILSAASSKHSVTVFRAPLVLIALGFPLIVTKKSDVTLYLQIQPGLEISKDKMSCAELASPSNSSTKRAGFPEIPMFTEKLGSTGSGI